MFLVGVAKTHSCPTFANGTGGSFLANAVAASSYSGASFLQWPHLLITKVHLGINMVLVEIIRDITSLKERQWGGGGSFCALGTKCACVLSKVIKTSHMISLHGLRPCLSLRLYSNGYEYDCCQPMVLLGTPVVPTHDDAKI